MVRIKNELLALLACYLLILISDHQSSSVRARRWLCLVQRGLAMLPRVASGRRGGSAGDRQRLDALFNELVLEASHCAPRAPPSARLRTQLEGLNPCERAALVNRRRIGSPPLFIAAHRGNAEMVEYLVHVCCADLEQVGRQPETVRQAEAGRGAQRGPALWAAAVAGHVAVVRVLADAGADINAASDTASTPLRAACCMSHMEVVRELVQRGADVHLADCGGNTCLMSSVQSPRQVALLLGAGADVHAADREHMTALHHAVHGQRCDTVRLLLGAGADPHARSVRGQDALLWAALSGVEGVVRLLVARAQYPPAHQADAMELFGATQLDEFNDPAACYNTWRGVTVMRHAPKARNLNKTGWSWVFGKDALQAREWTTLRQLEDGGGGVLGGAGQARAVEWLRDQALLVRARVLGPTHKDTVFRVMYRGAAYADQHRYTQCIVLWAAVLASCARPPRPPLPPPPAAHLQRTNNNGAEPSEALLAASALARLMLDACLGQLEGARYVPAHTHVLHVARLLHECMPALAARAALPRSGNPPAETQDAAMRCLVHLIFVLVRTTETEQERRAVADYCWLVVRSEYRSCVTGDSLLHLAVSRVTALRVTYFATEARAVGVFPCERTVRALLAGGADPGARNNRRSTPLHVAALPSNYSRHLYTLLVHGGAHTDTPNAHGDTPAGLAALVAAHSGMPRHPDTLQCLAASALVAGGRDRPLPAHLHHFVDLHRP